jgi:hypothetical protein
VVPSSRARMYGTPDLLSSGIGLEVLKEWGQDL